MSTSISPSSPSLNSVVSLKTEAITQVEQQAVNKLAEPVTPELSTAQPRSLTAASKIQIKENNTVEENKAVEVQISRIASESPAAHHTVDALLGNVVKLANLIDGEQSARFNLLSAYLGAEGSPSLSVIGQNDAGAFGKLINDVVHHRATSLQSASVDKSQHTDQSTEQAGKQKSTAVSDAWTLREKGTAFFNLTNSAYFKGLVQKTKEVLDQAKLPDASPKVKQQAEKLSEIVDANRVANLKPASARGGHGEAGGLELYPGVNESDVVQTEHPEYYEVKDDKGNVKKNPAALSDSKKGSLSGNQGEYRETPLVVDHEFVDKPRQDLSDKGQVYTSAAKLMDEGRLTNRELRLAQSSPRNQLTRTNYQFSTPDNIGSTFENGDKKADVRHDAALPLSNVVVQRGNGFAVWNVKSDTGFDRDAKEHAKPTVAGPSGTTDRFMSASRLLGPGTIRDLGLVDTSKGNKISDEEGAHGAEQLKELTRWLATGYLVDDNHHSMVEVNLGAANHGLTPQWGIELYTAPFSQTIKASNFSISSQQVLSSFKELPEVKVHRDYARDLRGGLEWRADGKRDAEDVIFHGRGDIEVITGTVKEARKQLAAQQKAAGIAPERPKGTSTGHAVQGDPVGEAAAKILAERKLQLDATTSSGAIPDAPPPPALKQQRPPGPDRPEHMIKV